MSNPGKFCFGFILTELNYFILHIDRRFARDLFAAQYTVESKQVNDDASNFIWRQRPRGDITAGELKNPSVIAGHICNDKAYIDFLKMCVVLSTHLFRPPSND